MGYSLYFFRSIYCRFYPIRIRHLFISESDRFLLQPQISIFLLGYFVGEQMKSENLLLNVLPKEIAAILKNKSRTIADHYAEASILFADMVGFTRLSAQLPPVEMVELLNELIKHDFMCESRGTVDVKGKGEMEVFLVLSVKERQPLAFSLR